MSTPDGWSCWSRARSSANSSDSQASPWSRCHLNAERPGDLVQLDCFYIGRLSGTKGRCWQYSAIDVASSFVWADVRVSPVNPATRFTSALVVASLAS
jgi:hypothetical protein